MTKQRPILWQLFPSFMAITVFVLLFTTWGVGRIYKQNYLDSMIESLRVQNLYLQSLIPRGDIQANLDDVAPICQSMSQKTHTRITITRGNGEVLLDTWSNVRQQPVQIGFPEFQMALSSPDRRGVAHRVDPEDGSRMLYFVEAIGPGPRPSGFIRLGLSMDRVDTNLDIVFRKIIIMVLIIGFAATGMSFLVAWQINRPIQQLIRAADRYAGGQLEQWSGTTSNIREFAALTQALRSMAGQLHERLRSESRQLNELEAIFASMVDAVLFIDNDECVLRYNHAASNLFHTGSTDITGRSILEVVRNTQLHQFIRKALTRNIPQEEDIIIHNKEDRYIHATGTAIEEGEGRVIGALIVLQDLTRIHKLERLRRDFVANVSHELKTPITAVKGFVETLLEGAVEDRETAIRFLDITLKHTNQLNAVIEDLLSLSRIEQETGNGGIRVQTGKIIDVIKAAATVCRKRAEENGVAIRVDCDPDLTVKMHPTLLQQALVNLVDNALKYGSDNTDLEIRVETENDRVLIHVRDHGPGIAEEHLGRLFERFYRVDKSRSRDLGGSGLGLAIVKHIVQAHRGRISVRSKVGEGTEFIIEIPIFYGD